jgi:hypothetical protein
MVTVKAARTLTAHAPRASAARANVTNARFPMRKRVLFGKGYRAFAGSAFADPAPTSHFSVT